LNKCIHCEKKFCDAHRLSENHECLARIVTDVKAFLIDQYKKLDTIVGDPKDAFLKRAEILVSIKRPGVSIELCNYIRENFDNSPEAIYLAATQCEKLKSYKKALDLYREACVIVPENALYDRSYNLLASKLVLEFKKRFKTAKKAFDTIDEKDQEIILRHLGYEELTLQIDELYTPPELKEKILDLKNYVSQNILDISQQMELIKEKFPLESLSPESTKYSINLGNGYSIIMNVQNYPKYPIFEFPFFIEEKFDIGSLSQRLYFLRTWSETQPYAIVNVISELKACLGFFGFGKVQLSEQFINMAKQTAREHAPNEFGAFIQLDRWVIWRLRLPARYFSTPFATGYYYDQFPFMDTSIVGFIHSHTLGSPDPSDTDRQSFKLYYLNMILGSTKGVNSLDELRVFDREGNRLEYEIMPLLEEDIFPIEEKKEDFKRDIYV